MPPKPDLWSVTITCPPAVAETLSELFEEGASTCSIYAPPRQDQAQIALIYEYKPDIAAIDAQTALFAASQNIQIPSPKLEPIQDLDWLKKVAGDFPPLQIGRWTIFGAAHKQAIKNPRLAMQIDATSAFGTGEHPTTRGCLIRLDRLLKKENLQNLLDMGCGSGILSLAFCKARGGKAVGIDMDAQSVTIAKDNARIGGAAARLRLMRGKGYGRPIVKESAPYDLIMANIFARPLCEMAKDLRRHLKPGGFVILSGILNHQARAVIAAHRMVGLHLMDKMRLGEWSVLAFRLPAGPI